MRVRGRTFVGRIEKGGEIVAHWDAIRDFLSSHVGSSVFLRFDIQPKEASERTKNYFFGYIIPEMRSVFHREYGEWLTEEGTYDAIRRVCPLFIKEERKDGKWVKRYREWEEMDQSETNEAIDWIYQWAAEQFSKVLDYPQK